MNKDYLKIALRSIVKHKSQSAINISGLTLGLAASILILLYVFDELSYDKFHKNAERIFRITETERYPGIIQQGLVGPTLEQNVPEIENFARVYATKIWGRNNLINHNETYFFTEGLFMVDPSFCDIFTFPANKGLPSQALKDPKNIVVTQPMADKLFGKNDPIGKVIIVDRDFEFTVAAVVNDVPRNSHIHFDFLISIENYNTISKSPGGLTYWGNSAFITYVLTKDKIEVSALEEKLTATINKYVPENYQKHIGLQSLTDIHLHSHFIKELEVNSDILYVYIFLTIAALIIFIACLNYMNLTTARSLDLTREIGMRKVAGANRYQLIRQFINEAILTSLFAMLFAILIVQIVLTIFNNAFHFSLYTNSLIPPGLFVFALLIGFVAGSFPAFYLTSFDPVGIFTGKSFLKGKSTTHVRKVLVVVQFAISICLIACTGVVKNQLDYIRNKNLGFQKEQIVVFPTMRNLEAVQKAELITNQFGQHPMVINVTASSQTPGTRPFIRVLQYSNNLGDNSMSVASLWTDQNFAKTYQLEFIAGRDFSPGNISDQNTAFIFNETAVKECEWKSPAEAIDQQVICNGKSGKVIGVVKDFNFLSMHSAVEPMIMHYDKDRFYSISVKLSTEDISTTIAQLSQQWKEILPTIPCDYYFLDQSYDQLYRADQKLGSFFMYFSLLAIFISCLGLFALASFSAEKRRKEIGVKKVLGASTYAIIMMLSKDFVKWVVIAIIIAVPLSYYAMHKWLENFAYRANLSWWIFALAGVLALGIALVTVSWQSWKAATRNPVEALKYE